MGYGEVGILSPGQSAFRDPTSQRAEAVGQGLQRASYLSQMDQFYTQLNEATRQFDLTYGLHERAQSLAERHDVWTEDVSRQQLELQGEQIDNQFSLGRRELDIKESLGSADMGYRQGMLDLARDEFELKQQEFDREASFEDRWADPYAQAGLDSYYSSGSGGGNDNLGFGSTPSSSGGRSTSGSYSYYGPENNYGFSDSYAADDDYDLDYGYDYNLDAAGTWF